MKIGLFGISGVHNFGCEAIVRGATYLIRCLYPDADIIYFSYNYDYDNKMLEDLSIKIIKIETKVNILNRTLSRISKTIHAKHRPLFMDTEKIFCQIDAIWSIGGDLYTIPEYKRRKPKYEYYNAIADFFDRAVNAGKDVILYGASVGPFGEYKKAVSYYLNNLHRYKLIMCREQNTFDYLKKLELKNIMFFPDPAFLVHRGLPKCIQKKYIGVNLSPLSLKEIYGDANVDNKGKIAHLIEQIVDVFDMPVLMIPHVISNNVNDDDLKFQKEIIDMMGDTYREKVEIADYTGGFLGLKPQIQKCFFVVSARMHCAINAIVEGVPALMLSYSSKSVGMCKYIYGSDEWVIGVSEIGSLMIPKMRLMYNRKEELTNYLVNRNKEIEDEFQYMLHKLKNGNSHL